MTWNATTIRSLLVAHGGTQAVFARLVGCREATLNRWLNGHTSPSPVCRDRLGAIAAQLSAAGSGAHSPSAVPADASGPATEGCEEPT